MNQTNRLQWKLYTNSKSLALLMALVVGISMFFATDCRGQETTNEKFSPETYAKSIKYENPGILNAHDILPPELLESEHHTVMEEVATYDLTNRFTILSTFGPFEAIGEDMLRIRIEEIKAIAVLQEIKKTKAFRDAAEQAAMSSYKGAKNLITHPVNTISGVPKGVGRLFSRVGEMFGGGRGEQEDSVAKELVGFSAIKRAYAHKLGVDVYSSNKVLQKELNRVSWAGFAGGVGVKLATRAVKGASEAAYFSIAGTKFAQGMNQILLDNAPEDLRRINREKLQQMGVGESTIEEFLQHTVYSPRHETILVHALAEMEGVKNRDKFIKQANFAVDEEDAFLFQRIAEMMYNYHKNVEPISETIPVRKVVVGYTAKQSVVVTLPIDYVYWTERADRGTDALLQLESLQRPVTSIKLFISGNLTSRAKLELMAKGIVVKENM
ncbi:MAG: hypothetical protein ACYSR0_06375 [Planctomycetota bacterium]|jgi:hypothetical protein